MYTRRIIPRCWIRYTSEQYTATANSFRACMITQDPTSNTSVPKPVTSVGDVPTFLWPKSQSPTSMCGLWFLLKNLPECFPPVTKTMIVTRIYCAASTQHACCPFTAIVCPEPKLPVCGLAIGFLAQLAQRGCGFVLSHAWDKKVVSRWMFVSSWGEVR